MEEKKNVSIAVVILNCICAVLWVINLIFDFTRGYTDSVQLILHIICAVCWSFVAIIYIFRYLKLKKVLKKNNS